MVSRTEQREVIMTMNCDVCVSRLFVYNCPLN